MITNIGVRFRNAGKVYYFSPRELDICVGDHVIVETARGVEYGFVVLGPKEVDDSKVIQPLKEVIRIATPKDDAREESNRKKEKEAFEICQKKIRAHNLEMKLIDAEYTFDNNKMLFYFTADSFLLGVWHFLISERSDSNCIGRDTLVDWYGTSTETYGKSQIGTELRRNVWEPLGREIRVIPSERKVLKEEKAVSQDNAEQEHKLFVYDKDSLSEEEKESLERLKKNRILRDLLRACHIGTCDKKNDDNKDDNNYAENYELFVMALKRCELLVLNNNNAGRIKEDVITLCKRLEKFIKLIKQKDTNNSSDKSYSAYNNSVKQKITSRKEVLDRVYTTLYGHYPVFSDEQLSDLLSVVKI